MSQVKSSLWSLIKSIHLHHNAEFILCPEGICQVFHGVYLINSVQSWFEERQQRYHPGPVPPVYHLWNIRYKTSGTESIVDVMKRLVSESVFTHEILLCYYGKKAETHQFKMWRNVKKYHNN